MLHPIGFTICCVWVLLLFSYSLGGACKDAVVVVLYTVATRCFVARECAMEQQAKIKFAANKS